MASYRSASLNDLPSEILLKIFGNCDWKTLLSLAQVCQNFNVLASQDCLWEPVVKKCINIPGKRRKNSSVKHYCLVSIRWVRGHYLETTLATSHTRFLPWLQLTNTVLFVSEGDKLKVFNLQRKRRANIPVCSRICGQDDITKFVVKNDKIVCGDVNKTVSLWQYKRNNFVKLFSFFGHTMIINCVDFVDNIILSGSKDETIKMWSVSGGCLRTLPIGDPVRSIAVNPFKRNSFVAGSSGFLRGHCPLKLYDCTTGRDLGDLICESSQRHGAGIYDVKFESANTLLSCGYDTAVRMWDVRNNSRRCVRTWDDSFGSAVYCIESDRRWMILSGTFRHGLVRIWDKRMSRSVNQYYADRNSQSPVYSIKFNQSKLFVALDKKVKILNFDLK